jgi:hypothetical protein
MNTASLEKQFARMGAALAVRRVANGFSVDVQRDGKRSRFELTLNP